MSWMIARRVAVAIALNLAAASCAPASAGAGAPFRKDAPDALAGTRYIDHVIVLIHENRSFDDLFATFPGADGATEGKMSNGQTVKLKKSNLEYPYDLAHSWQSYIDDYDGGKMDGFDLEGGGDGHE